MSYETLKHYCFIVLALPKCHFCLLSLPFTAVLWDTSEREALSVLPLSQFANKSRMETLSSDQRCCLHLFIWMQYLLREERDKSGQLWSVYEAHWAFNYPTKKNSMKKFFFCISYFLGWLTTISHFFITNPSLFKILTSAKWLRCHLMVKLIANKTYKH